MSDRKLAFMYSAEMERLSYPADCPFKTGRVPLTRQQLRSFGLLDGPGCKEIPARPATRTELSAFHTAAYLAELQRAAGGDLTLAGLAMGLGGPDTPAFKDMAEYGAWACGAALRAADLLLEGQADVVFSLWGGFHHAFPERAAGFCYLNDVVLACLRLAGAGRRVAYVDVDAHHGDGVQEAFYQRADVLTISLHESGKTLFPWGGFEDEIGAGAGLGYNVNVPLPAGTYDEAFLSAFQQVVLPLLDWFRPDVLVLELGMDALAGDPLTHLALTNNAHVAVLEALLHRRCPLLVLGGGGYHVQNTVRGWARAWQICCAGSDGAEVSAGLGGVFLGSAEWAGGLRDPVRPVSPEQRRAVEPELRATLERLGQTIFRLHRLESPCGGGAAAGG